MKEKHITELIDNVPVTNLSESELVMIRAHVETCPPCERALRAAQVSALLMKEHVADAAVRTSEANPFFQTRVLAAWREQQALGQVSSFRRLWSATGALVASMVATTAALAVLTFTAPSANPANQQAVALVPNSAESVVLDQDQTDNQMTDDQVINAVYVDDDEDK